ncbi:MULTISPECIES: YheV family putative zinc ribbon protein [Alkalimonas]|uniref:YheV family putative zinc ribbon protein n=1 Tax=Alkalimonas mucilaginosa TaxID=3057676 RepID=A0ABU7JJL2_9GAMM|nr:YheV family putative zinc ribbon protein [Alkalimonas sp. MEB004]MEE2025888.1 YheV family putative zinc ribbon protein [Alkalimonas sp. MEB004]
MDTRKKKRFIAGATCPKCHAMDSMMLFLEHNVEKVECVHCGYQMTQPDAKVSKAAGSSEQLIGVFKPD